MKRSVQLNLSCERDHRLYEDTNLNTKHEDLVSVRANVGIGPDGMEDWTPPQRGKLRRSILKPTQTWTTWMTLCSLALPRNFSQDLCIKPHRTWMTLSYLPFNFYSCVILFLALKPHRTRILLLIVSYRYFHSLYHYSDPLISLHKSLYYNIISPYWITKLPMKHQINTFFFH